jgi:hypothetical protein
MESKGRRHWLLWLAVTVGVFLAIALGLPRLIDLDRYRESLASVASKNLGATVELGHIHWGMGNGLWLKVESLTVTGGLLRHSQLRAGTIYVRIAIAPLLTRRQLVVQELIVNAPQLTLQLTDPPDQIPAQDTAPTKVATGPRLSYVVTTLRIESGEFHLKDQRTNTRQLPDIDFRDIGLTIKQLGAGAEVPFALTAVNAAPSSSEGRGALQATGVLQGLGADFSLNQPQLKANATVDSLSVDAIKPWIDNPVLAQRLQGVVGATVNYQGWPGTPGSARGELDLGSLAYTDTALWPSAMPGVPAKFTFSARLDNHALAFSQLQLALGDILIRGQTTIQQWRGQAVASGSSFNAQLPVAAIAPLVPWNVVTKDADRIRELLAGGGRITVEEFKLPDIALADKAVDPKVVFNSLTAAVQLSGLSLHIGANLPPLEHIGGNLELRDGMLRGNDIGAQIGPLSLPGLSFSTTELLTLSKARLLASGPVELAADDKPAIRALLAPYGLADLNGSADVELNLAYDKHKPQHWTTEVALDMQNVKLISSNAANKLLLQGKFKLQQSEQIDLVLTGIKGHLNNAPLAINGTIADLGGAQMQVDIAASSENLQLGPLTEFLPGLNNMALTGTVDADVAVYFQQQRPQSTRLKGTVAGKALGLSVADYRIDQGMVQLQMAGNQINIKQASALLNDQAIKLTGGLTRDQQIRGKLQLTSPALDIDKLLANNNPAANPEPLATGETTGKTTMQLPPLLRSAALELDGKIAGGKYRGQVFEKLHLWFNYDQGKVTDHVFSVAIAEGSVETRGNLDLRDLSSVPFAIHHTIDGVQLATLLPIALGAKSSITGQLSSQGRIEGRSGNQHDLLASLRGELRVAAGPGSIAGGGFVGNTLFKLLEVINLEGILSGKMDANLRQKGIAYTSLGMRSTLTGRGLEIGELDFLSPAIIARGHGLIDLEKQSTDIDLEVTVLGSLDKALGLVPLAGSAAANLMKAYLKVAGPLNQPRIKVRQVSGMAKALQDSITAPAKRVGRGLDSIKEWVKKP